MADFDWTDDRVSELRDLITAGDSACQVAERFGITRSAVIGKCHRAGIEFPSRPGYSGKRDRATARRKRVHEAFGALRVVERSPGKPVSLFDLKDQQCHYVIDGGYCGAPSWEGTAYCCEHYSKMHAASA